MTPDMRIEDLKKGFGHFVKKEKHKINEKKSNENKLITTQKNANFT